MNDAGHPAVSESKPAELRGLRERLPLLSLLRKDVASNGPAWLPLVLVLGAIGAVMYADRRVVSISLTYLYILPLGVGAIFLSREISYSLIGVCILLHDYDVPRHMHLGLRIFHNLSAMLCFAFVVYLIQRYIASCRTSSGKRLSKRFNSSATTWNWLRKCSGCFFPWANQRLPDSKLPA